MSGNLTKSRTPKTINHSTFTLVSSPYITYKTANFMPNFDDTCVSEIREHSVRHYPEVNTIYKLNCGVSPYASIWHPIGTGISPWTYVNCVTRCERIKHFFYSTNRQLTLYYDWCNMLQIIFWKSAKNES